MKSGFGQSKRRYFEIESDKSGVLWTIYPKSTVSLHETTIIIHGELPEGWFQKTSQPAVASLRDRESDVATAHIYDAGPVSVEFTVKNGKAVEHLWIDTKYSR